MMNIFRYVKVNFDLNWLREVDASLRPDMCPQYYKVM